MLSNETRVSFVNLTLPPNGTPHLQVNTGNPHLKPATTHNFDFGVEYYHDQVGVMKLSVFYKYIDNLLQTNITSGAIILENLVLPDHEYFQAPIFDPDNLFVTGVSPENSEHGASIWGVEAHFERQFTFLPGFWNGFGTFANYTYTKSSKVESYSWAEGPGVPPADPEIFEFTSIPFNQQPKHSGTAALTYNKHGVDATLAYSFQSRVQTSFRPRGLRVYNEGLGTLDFRLEYYFDVGAADYRIYVEASDIMNGTSSPDIEQTFGGVGSTPKYYSRATYLGGRVFKMGLTATF